MTALRSIWSFRGNALILYGRAALYRRFSVVIKTLTQRNEYVCPRLYLCMSIVQYKGVSSYEMFAKIGSEKIHGLTAWTGGSI